MHNQTQNRYLELVRNIDIIQFESLEAFSFHVITLSYICFLPITSMITGETAKSLLYFLHPAWSQTLVRREL